MMDITKVNVTANWSGCYPCLCHGEWTLTVNDADMTPYIPRDLRDRDMNTHGTYQSWHFDKDWRVVWNSYNDGLDSKDWILANDYWLQEITSDDRIKHKIFKAFQKADFRCNSCGGCI